MRFSRRSAKATSQSEAAHERAELEEPAGPSVGPYDQSEVPVDQQDQGERQLDLGALRVPVVDGVEVRVQADQEGRVQQVVLVAGANALQLGVFAAPRSEGIWDEVRAEIQAQLETDGFPAEESQGEYGMELRSQVKTPDGSADLRFVGVDGPRWLLRALFQGPVAADPTAAPVLLECLHGVVVYRGVEAMPVREPLPLRLPREIAEQAQQRAAS